MNEPKKNIMKKSIADLKNEAFERALVKLGGGQAATDIINEWKRHQQAEKVSTK